MVAGSIHLSRVLWFVWYIYIYIISYNYIYIDISCWWVESGWVPILAGWSWLKSQFQPVEIRISLPVETQFYLCATGGAMSRSRRLGEDDGRTAFSAHGEDVGSPRWRCRLKNWKMDGFPTRKLEVWVGKMGFKQQQLGTQQGHVQGEFLTTTTVLWLFLLLTSSGERWATLVRYG